MHVDVPGHTRPGSLADVHSQVDAVWRIEPSQHGLHPLRQIHHLVGSGNWQFLDFVKMSVRNDHDVAWGVGISIQNGVAVLTAVYDAHFGVVPLLG